MLFTVAYSGTTGVNKRFVYLGKGDTVRCWACDGGLQRWDPIDDPWIEHCRWFPTCPFALQEKGERYIQLVQLAAETGDEVGMVYLLLFF